MSLFGNPSGTTPAGGLFGSASNPAATPTTTAPAAGSPSPFNIFGAAPAATPTTGIPAAAPATGGLFGGPIATPAAGATSAAPKPLFSGASPFSLPKPADTVPTSTVKPGESSFFTKPAGTTTSTAAPSLFGLPSKPPEASTSAAPPAAALPTAGTTASPFGNFLKPTAAPAPSAPTDASKTTAPTASPFGAGSLFGKPAENTSATSATPAATGGATLGTSLFGGPPAEKKDQPGAPKAPSLEPPKPTGASLFGGSPLGGTALGASTLGASTLGTGVLSGPTLGAGALGGSTLGASALGATTAASVAPPSMLRGKTIEEIVNKWTSDLETHVGEFNKFASEVAAWDRALIENGNNLSALYSHVLAAQQEQSTVDQALDHIEQQQKDLAVTLDAYEKVSQEIFGGQGGGLKALDSGPADTERDKNYMLATDLHAQLEDLSSSLTQMIETVNSLSNSSSPDASSDVDQPITQIAQILGSHLDSLQWIDGAVRDVEGKVSDVEKRIKESNYVTTASNVPKPRGFGLR